ncbi:hypothetical protein HRED_09822, partial [Candidatus Haloredivivus sp. G17]
PAELPGLHNLLEIGGFLAGISPWTGSLQHGIAGKSQASH